MKTKSLFEIFNSNIAKLAAFLAAITAVTTFFVNLYTQQLHNDLDACDKNLSFCEANKYNQKVLVGDKEVTFKEVIHETEYLRFLADYYDAVGKYQQLRSEENQQLMILATNNLASYIISQRQKFIRGSRDSHTTILIISDDKMRFDTKEYYIPAAVSLKVKDLKAYALEGAK